MDSRGITFSVAPSLALSVAIGGSAYLVYKMGLTLFAMIAVVSFLLYNLTIAERFVMQKAEQVNKRPPL